MRQPNLPKKYTTLAQVWISMLLVILAVVFAFTPLLSLNMENERLKENVSATFGSLAEMLDDDDLAKISIPDTVDISTIKMINSTTVVAKFISITITALSDPDEEALEKAQDDMDRLLHSEKGQESVIMMVALLSQVIDFEKTEEADEPLEILPRSVREEYFGVAYENGVVTDAHIDFYIRLKGIKNAEELGGDYDAFFADFATTIASQFDPRSEVEKIVDFMRANNIMSSEEYNALVQSCGGSPDMITERALRNAVTDEQFKKFNELGGYEMVSASLIDSDTVSTGIIGIVEGVLSFIVLLYLIVYIVIWPFILAIIALVALIRALVHITNPAAVTGKTSGTLIGALSFAISTLILISYFPGITWGSGMTAICIISLLSIALNIAVTRVRAYAPMDFKYSILVQGASAARILGLGLFLGGLLKTGFLRSFVDSLKDYLAKSTAEIADINRRLDFNEQYFGQYRDSASLNFMFLLDAILLITAAIMALCVVSALIKSIATRIGLLNKKAAGPGSLTAAIFALITCTLPIVASKLENKYTYAFSLENGYEATPAGSLFVISDEGMSALIMMWVGAALLLCVGIAFLILRGILCKGMTSAEAKAVLTGQAPDYDPDAPSEKVLAEEPPVEDAPVEDAPVEDVPVEDVPVEDAPIEDAPVEDSPIEDAPVEDAPVEDVPVEDVPVEDVPAEEPIQS